MKRGFTIAELTIVLTVLAILISLAALGSSAMMDRARASQRSSMASIISAAAEKYYDLNNEYPSSYELGGLTTALPPANYNLASQKLGLPVDTFKTGSVTFTPCGIGANCSTSYVNKTRVYYVTRYNQTETGYSVVFIPINSSGAECRYEIPGSDVGATAFLIMFWSQEDQGWKVARSSHGTIDIQRRSSPTGTWSATDTSAGGCPFTKL